ncbi:MAG: hypothetical protein IJV60_02075 [Prevotella sp.]|nr:hypothetical protein [Prevotella sp.]MBQ8059050.1 hypothetical protein [Prevotella sp.]
MKNFKYMSLMVALLSVLTLSFTSCSSDDDDEIVSAPEVTLTEANLEGDEICVQADIKAQGRTASVIIEVFKASDGSLITALPVTDSKFINVLEIPGFHKHVHLDGLTVAEGDVLKLTVTDMNGKSTTVQKNITAEEDEDEHDHE